MDGSPGSSSADAGGVSISSSGATASMATAGSADEDESCVVSFCIAELRVCLGV